jgi:uncharacterized protein YukE
MTDTNWEHVAQELKRQNTELRQESQALKMALDTLKQGRAGERLAYFEQEQTKWLAAYDNVKRKFDGQEAVIAQLQDKLALAHQALATLHEEYRQNNARWRSQADELRKELDQYRLSGFARSINPDATT